MGQQHVPPLFRRTDPATSKAAAAAIVPKLGELQWAVLEAVRLFPGRTRNELAKIHGWHPSEVSKRLPEMERQGLVTRGPGVRDMDRNRAGKGGRMRLRANPRRVRHTPGQETQ